jgi:hypothetical protein
MGRRRCDHSQARSGGRMKILTHLFARFLSNKGHRDRKATARQRYQQTHDELRASLNMPPIKWRNG